MALDAPQVVTIILLASLLRLTERKLFSKYKDPKDWYAATSLVLDFQSRHYLWNPDYDTHLGWNDKFINIYMRVY